MEKIWVRLVETLWSLCAFFYSDVIIQHSVYKLTNNLKFTKEIRVNNSMDSDLKKQIFFDGVVISENEGVSAKVKIINNYNWLKVRKYCLCANHSIIKKIRGTRWKLRNIDYGEQGEKLKLNRIKNIKEEKKWD